MKVNGLENGRQTSFGTMYSKYLHNQLTHLSISRQLKPEHVNNIEKVFKDGNPVVLDVIHRQRATNEKNNPITSNPYLVMNIGKDIIDIKKFENNCGDSFYDELLKVFSDKFKLHEIIENVTNKKFNDINKQSVLFINNGVVVR